MALTVPILAMTFPAAASSGITAYVGVVLDTNGNVKLPAGTPETTFIGVADINGVQSDGQGNYNMVGICTIYSDGSGVVNPGNPVVLVGSTGQGKATTLGIPASPGTQGNWVLKQVIGTCMNRAQVPATANAPIILNLSPYIIPSAP